MWCLWEPYRLPNRVCFDSSRLDGQQKVARQRSATFSGDLNAFNACMQHFKLFWSVWLVAAATLWIILRKDG